jgi:hypothetical protein
LVSSVLGEKVAKPLESIPLSNDNLSWRISDMASNVTEQLIEKVKSSEYYSLQLDKSTDVSNISSHVYKIWRWSVSKRIVTILRIVAWPR